MQVSSGSEKQRLRSQFRAARAALTDSAREHARAAIRAAVLARVDTAGWRCVTAYVPYRSEPGSVELLEALVERGVRVLVPVALADRDLDWAEWTPGGASRPLGRTAVAHADALFVPAFAAARDGTRLGRGGGSYDRALLRRGPQALVAALLFRGELVDSLPRDPWDQPVDHAIDPDGWTALEWRSVSSG